MHMSVKSLYEACRQHGYTNIPLSTRVLRDAVYLDQTSDVDPDKLIDLASWIERVEKSPDEFTNKKNQIELSDHVWMKGVCLSLYSDDVEEIEKFRSLCYANLPKALSWFHQCNTRGYQMFEFWNPQSDAMHNIANLIACEMKMPLVTCLKNVYRPDVIIEQSTFKPYNPDDYHQKGEFFG